jgi:hypothetical protein
MTNEELLMYAEEHIWYEIQQLIYSRNILVSDQKTLIKNVALDSLVIHLRNLHEFLYGSGKDLVTASLYFDGSTKVWKMKRPKQSEQVIKIREKASKQVAHLTKDRLEKYQNHEEKSWRFDEVTREILKTMQVFAELVGEKKIGKLKTQLLDKLSP